MRSPGWPGKVSDRSAVSTASAPASWGYRLINAVLIHREPALTEENAMTETTVYQWSWIAQGATVAVDVEGWGRTDCVDYQATPYPLGPDVFPAGPVRLSTGIKLGTDGSATHTAEVQNRAPFHPCAMDLRAVWDDAPDAVDRAALTLVSEVTPIRSRSVGRWEPISRYAIPLAA
jgi:hypothetical protein